jgi:hypothetical protein
MKLFHTKKGILTPAGTKHKPIGNKVVQLYADEKGNQHELDGTEKPLKDVEKNYDQITKNLKTGKEEQKTQELQDEMDFEKNLAEHDKNEAQVEEKSIMHTELLGGVKNASEAIVEAVKGIPETVIPEVVIPDHVDEYKTWKDQILEALKIEIPEVDLEPVIKAIENIKIPEAPKPKDYSSLLEEIKNLLPKETDLTPVIEAVRNIPRFEIPQELIYKDHLKVSPDRVGSGGSGGMSQTDSDALQKIAENNYDSSSIDLSDPNNILISYKLSGVVVATETINISGSTIDIIET